MAEPALRRVSYSEYLALEAGSERKHEWYDGQIQAMAGGKPVHALLAGRVIATLHRLVSPRGCDVYSSDLRIRVPATGLATYPDVSVLCAPPIPHDEDPDAATNPVILVEVLSRTTERWDRTGKRLHCQQLASLRVYVLVDSQQQRVEWYTRAADGAWVYRSAGPGQVAEIDDGISLDVDALYDRTDVPAWDLPPLMLGEPDTEWADQRV